VALGNTAAGSFFATTTRGTAGTPSKLTIKRVHKNAKKAKFTGTLSPPQGLEQIYVSRRPVHGKTWTTSVVTAASNGQFNNSFKVKKPTYVVAEWIGDGDRAGAGTQALLVKPPTPSPPNTKIGQATIHSSKGKAAFKFKATGKKTGFQCALVKNHKKRSSRPADRRRPTRS